MLQQVFYFLGTLCAIYSAVIVVRIVMDWFNPGTFGSLSQYMHKITDPYLGWFRRIRVSNISAIDLSPLFALIVLNIANAVFINLGKTGRITLGFILSLFLSIIWSAVSFILFFYIVVMVLRLIAYFVNADIHAPFWRIIDYISRPVTYRISRIFFRNRIANYVTGIILSIAALIAIYFALAVLLNLGEFLLRKLPF